MRQNSFADSTRKKFTGLWSASALIFWCGDLLVALERSVLPAILDTVVTGEAMPIPSTTTQ
jgi:hypothetical protein